MDKLISIVYDDMVSADTAAKDLRAELERGELKLKDIVTVVNKPMGLLANPKVSMPLRASTFGAVAGAVVGMLVARPLVGAVVGASVGAGLGAMTGAAADNGIDKEYMRSLSEAQGLTTSMLFLLLEEQYLDQTIALLRGTGGRVVDSTLSDSELEALENSIADGAEFKDVNAATI